MRQEMLRIRSAGYEVFPDYFKAILRQVFSFSKLWKILFLNKSGKKYMALLPFIYLSPA